ncbi:MAG TPA: hypothetical protein EYH58_00385 [Aquifex aeolicus]|nr:hypothetical protein [Aquifex aeolicus]
MGIFLFLLLSISLCLGLESLGVFGKVYPIAEENILEKIKNYKILEFKNPYERIKKAAEINLNLPYAKEFRTQEEKIVYEVPADIRVGDKIIAKKGERINVLEKIKLRKVYVFLEDKMLPQFMDFAKRYPTTFLITKGNVYELQKKYPDLSIYIAFPIIVERLGIERVPTLIYQSGEKLVKVELPWAEGKVYIPF